jgi:hypothetical protein
MTTAALVFAMIPLLLANGPARLRASAWAW